MSLFSAYFVLYMRSVSVENGFSAGGRVENRKDFVIGTGVGMEASSSWRIHNIAIYNF